MKLQHQFAGQVIVTLGSLGAAIVGPDSSIHRIPGLKMDVLDTTGAGDCFNAALACVLAQGQQLIAALEFAIAASALSVTKLGAQCGMPTLVEVRRFMHNEQ